LRLRRVSREAFGSVYFPIKTLDSAIGPLKHVHYMVQIGVLRQDEKLCVRGHFSSQPTSPERQAKISGIFAFLLHANNRQTPLVNSRRQQWHHAKGYFGLRTPIACNDTHVLGKRLRQTLNLPRTVVEINQ